MLAFLVKPGSVAVSTLASVVGQIISMSLALGPITFENLGFYQPAYFWFDKLPLLVEATEEVVFWLHHIDQFNGQPIWFSPGIVTRTGYSDASILIMVGMWYSLVPMSLMVNGMLNKVNVDLEGTESC